MSYRARHLIRRAAGDVQPGAPLPELADGERDTLLALGAIELVADVQLVPDGAGAAQRPADKPQAHRRKREAVDQ